MKCFECKYMYSNETMGTLYICANANSENFLSYTGTMSEDECEDGVPAFSSILNSDDESDDMDGLHTCVNGKSDYFSTIVGLGENDGCTDGKPKRSPKVTSDIVEKEEE